jgi:putative PIN family toxin of toxin-antitoxin system
VVIVIDTNVLFSAFAFPSGVSASVVSHCLQQHEVRVSAHIVDELRRHLNNKTGLTLEQVEAVIALLLEASGGSGWVEPAPVRADACRDPNDLPVLGTAAACGASVLLTGDKDLLVLKTFEDCLILAPRDFLDRFLPGGLR